MTKRQYGICIARKEVSIESFSFPLWYYFMGLRLIGLAVIFAWIYVVGSPNGWFRTK